ncbi:hypothetical protein [Natrialba aegyptia]|uniref:Small CPxCG-related zinc finger protein n=1 Tax=Natrialba aegyptia DSM 13077 TaxID=1227491 RepID=M0B0U0_9EURY|nr:hypothetical protein [Natrialba aegyptia]ELZ03848.1 hypothetical protein C480_15835 [Natrialba aegyptia DSM 13077]
MPLHKLLPEFLQREDETANEPDGPVLHECRHCGSKFDDAPTTCPVCGASEIATYEFSSEPTESEPPDGSSSGHETDAAPDETDTDGNSGPD